MPQETAKSEQMAPEEHKALALAIRAAVSNLDDLPLKDSKNLSQASGDGRTPPLASKPEQSVAVTPGRSAISESPRHSPPTSGWQPGWFGLIGIPLMVGLFLALIIWVNIAARQGAF